MLFCHTVAVDKQNKTQDTRKGAWTPVYAHKPTLDFFSIFSTDLNQSVEQNVKKQKETAFL